jgi:hypothetical protein
MTFQSSLVIRYSAYVWNGVCGMSLLHLDDPDRLRAIHHEARGSRVLLFVREHRREGRAGGVTEPFRCLGFARYVSHEGERILFAHQWRSAGGWSGPSRRGGCRGWGWRFEGATPINPS